MDWPLIGAVAGVTALAGVTVYGAIAVTRSVPERPKKAPQVASLTLVEPRTDLAGSQAPRLTQSDILVWSGSSEGSSPNNAPATAVTPRISTPSSVVRVPAQPQPKPATPPAQKPPAQKKTVL